MSILYTLEWMMLLVPYTKLMKTWLEWTNMYACTDGDGWDGRDVRMFPVTEYTNEEGEEPEKIKQHKQESLYIVLTLIIAKQLQSQWNS